MKIYISCCFIIMFCISACAPTNHLNYLSLYAIPPPTADVFTHCFNYGCQSRVELGLPSTTKGALIQLFSSKPVTADKERALIIQAIALLETDIGPLAGTHHDKGGTFSMLKEPNRKKHRQLDCVDESTNTTIYLHLLQQLNLIKFHTIDFPVKRSPIWGGNGWWHQSAAIKDTKTGIVYAVDSWFLDNGKAGFIVPVKEWKQNWHPDDTKPLKN